MRIAIVLCLFVLAGCLQMERGIDVPPSSVSGRAVRAEDPTTGLPFARVKVGARFSRADAEGLFLLRDVPVGSYDLTVDGIDGDRHRSSSRVVTIGRTAAGLPEFVLLGDIGLVADGDLVGRVGVRDANGGDDIPVRNLSDQAIVRIYASTRCASCGNDDTLRGVVNQADAEPTSGAFAMGVPVEPIQLQAVAYLPAIDPNPGINALGDEAVILGERIVGITAPVSITDVGTPAVLQFDSIDIDNPPSPGTVTVYFNSVVEAGTQVVARRATDSADCAVTVADERSATTTAAGGTVVIDEVPVGLWRFIACSPDLGASEAVLVTPGSVDVLLQLAGPTCGTRGASRSDCDGDGVPGLLATELDGCAASCETTADRCEVDGVGSFDCEDDGDDQIDARETGCYGSEFGGDDDGDGLCAANDAYPSCLSNIPSQCEGGEEGEGEGEGEGDIGEGEGEGEANIGEGEGEGEGDIGEGEGEGEEPLVLCTLPPITPVVKRFSGRAPLVNPVIAVGAKQTFEPQLVIAAGIDGLITAEMNRGEPVEVSEVILWSQLAGLGLELAYDRNAVALSTLAGITTLVLHGDATGTGKAFVINGDAAATDIFAAPRFEHDLLPLAGRVFAIGGVSGDGSLVASVEQIHPVVVVVGTLQQPRRGQAAIVLPTDNNVDVGFVIGGFEGGGGRIQSVERLSMAAGANGPSLSVATPSLMRARGDAKVALLNDGRMAVVGGDVDGSTWEIWDPAGDNPEGPFLLANPRVRGHAVATVSGGGVFVGGGVLADGTPSGRAEMLRVDGCSAPIVPADGEMLVQRSDGVAWSADGFVYVAGDNSNVVSPNASVEQIDFNPRVSDLGDSNCSRAVSSSNGHLMFARCSNVGLLIPGTANATSRPLGATDLVMVEVNSGRTTCLSCVNNQAMGAGTAGEDIATDGTAVAFISNGDFSGNLMNGSATAEPESSYAYVAFVEDALFGVPFVTLVSNDDGASVPAVVGPIGMARNGSGDLLIAHGAVQLNRDDSPFSAIAVDRVSRFEPRLDQAPSSQIDITFSELVVTSPASLPLSVGSVGSEAVLAFSQPGFFGTPTPVWFEQDNFRDIRETAVRNLGSLRVGPGCVRVHSSSDGDEAVCILSTGDIRLIHSDTVDSELLGSSDVCSSASCPVAEVENRRDETGTTVSVVAYDTTDEQTAIFVGLRNLQDGSELGQETVFVAGESPSLDSSGRVVTTIVPGGVRRYAIDELFTGLQ